MKKPKVAIYMPCYNHEKYVKEAMDSILRQTYKNWELYVVNDGSTDKTGSILESYHDERIHYYNFEKNTKFVGAANFLQKKIEGIKVDYIAVMASDDMWEGNKLEKQIDILIKHPEYRACFTWDKIIFDIDAGAYKNNMTYSHKENVNRYEWVKMLLNKGNCFNANSILMEKDIFYELGRMNENYMQLGDWRLWLKLAEKYPFYLVEEELTYYRRHGANLSEPSVEVFIRSFNEEERIVRELIHSMEKNTFRRIFYKNLSYTECNTDEELLAEKFIVMIENHKASFEQAAIDLYFEHCDNDLFTGTLEKKYRFTSAEFINMTGNGGLSFVINNILNKMVLKKNGVKIFSPAMSLLNAIDDRNLNESVINKFLYSTLLDLYVMASTYEGGADQFKKIRKLVDNIRSLNEKKKVLFIIAETSDWDIGSLEETKEENLEYLVAFIPTRKDAFYNEEKMNLHKNVPDFVKQIELYNKADHCLRFLWELSESTDIICYVDCLEDKYECREMAAGYSLGIENRCILKEDVYNHLKHDDDMILQVMQDIKIYQ